MNTFFDQINFKKKMFVEKTKNTSCSKIEIFKKLKWTL